MILDVGVPVRGRSLGVVDEMEAQRDWFRTRWCLERGFTPTYAQRLYERDGVFRLSMGAEVRRAERDEHAERVARTARYA
jgi:hypothetical protein